MSEEERNSKYIYIYIYIYIYKLYKLYIYIIILINKYIDKVCIGVACYQVIWISDNEVVPCWIYHPDEDIRLATPIVMSH
jgi:hypothetical protein